MFVGDYADDWNAEPMHTIATWRALKDLQEKYPDKVNLVMGNHDYAYLLSFTPASGGYNVMTKLLLNTEENKDLKKWLSEIPIQLYINDVTYSHAGIDVNWNTSTDEKFLWDSDSPLWTRPDDTIYGPEPQVFGHTPSATCWEVEDGNIWCIDTFSTYPDGRPVGDETVLEIINGKEFKKVKLK